MRLEKNIIFFIVTILAVVISYFVIFSNMFITDVEPNNELENLKEISKSTSTNKQIKQKEMDCGVGKESYNTYIKEYKIPSTCVKPLGIIVDGFGKVWFTQTNTGNIGVFNPQDSTFKEFKNKFWSSNFTSMMWGIAYTNDDNEIWFTDERNDKLWKFSIDKEEFFYYDFPVEDGGSLPQKILVEDNKFFVNDFTGNKIVVISHNDLDNGDLNFSSIKTPDGFFTGEPVISKNKDLWFMIWKYQGESFLMRYDQNLELLERYSMPEKILAPNGLVEDSKNGLWISDTASSSFFNFEPETGQFIEYTTSNPRISSYGNASGLIKTPISRPYWNSFADDKLLFNEQTANVIAVFDPKNESLVEYLIPSKNPHWADCGELTDCGVAQVFDFVFAENKVWFTEWVENNIGVLDLNAQVPVEIELNPQIIKIGRGEVMTIEVILPDNISSITKFEFEALSPNMEIQLRNNNTKTDRSTVFLDVIATEKLLPGKNKILVSVKHDDITISKYLTVEAV